MTHAIVTSVVMLLYIAVAVPGLDLVADAPIAVA